MKKKYIQRYYYLKTSCKAALLAGTSVIFMSGAYAQEIQSSTKDTSAQTEIAIDEIIVTSQKRGEQRLMDVPAAISAFSEAGLERINADSFLDYARFVPGLGFQISSPAGGRDDLRGGRRLNIRGIESGADGIPTTAFYINDTPVPVMDPRLFDIERVEVLRGPQGTLYGANSMGGTVRVVVNKPNLDSLEYRGDATVSSTHKGGESFQTNSMFNIPLSKDVLALRGVVFYRNEAGYIDNIKTAGNTATDIIIDKDINKETSWGVRLATQYRPSEFLEINASIFHQEIAVDDTPKFETAVGDLQYANKMIAEKQDNEFTLYSLEVEYSKGNFSVFSSTSYFSTESGVTDDLEKLFFTFGLPKDPGTSMPSLANISENRFTEELRVVYDNGDNFNAVFGIFYQNTNRFFAQDLPNDGLRSIFPLEDVLFTGTQKNDEKQIAVFGEVSYKITERLDITIGARWFEAKQEQLARFDGVLNGGLIIEGGTSSENDISPKLRMAYNMTEDTLVYASATKGFRPGGPTNLVPIVACGDDLAALGLTTAPSQFVSDTLWSYEIGGKTSLADGRLNLSAAAYYIDWTDVQQSVRLACGFGFVGNVGEAVSKGFELEVSANPFNGFDLTASVGYTDSKFTFDSPEVGIADGDRLPSVPKWTASLSARYSFPIAGSYSGYVYGDFQYVDKSLSDSFRTNGSLAIKDSYKMVNFRFGSEFGENWEIALFLDNAFDVRPVMNHKVYAGFDSLSPETSISRPRTFGLRLSYRK